MSFEKTAHKTNSILLLGVSLCVLLIYYLFSIDLFPYLIYKSQGNSTWLNPVLKGLLMLKITSSVFLVLSVFSAQVKRDFQGKSLWFTFSFIAGCFVYFWSEVGVYIGLYPHYYTYVLSFIGYLIIGCSLLLYRRVAQFNISKDVFNSFNESFIQQEKKIVTKDSLNIATQYFYKGKHRSGWINVLNPFRGTLVIGSPGSGKTYTVITSFIEQHLKKGFSMLVYDFKFDDLTKTTFLALCKSNKVKENKTKFYVLNFDDMKTSHRCNAIHPEHLQSIYDAYEAAHSILLNLNKAWIQRQGDFFVESPIVLLTAIIWFLKLYQNGKYCTLPHAIELANQPYKSVFTILSSYTELENYLSAFRDALQGGAQDQLQGQIASLKIPLSRLVSKNLYWVMSGNDFTLDLNNPMSPKVLCIGSSPQRQQLYSGAIGLYMTRIMKLINKKGQNKMSLIIDELPTVFLNGLDHFIATARSNKISTTLSLQDYSQLVRDYGEKQSKVIFNSLGNIISGQVLGETAKLLSERFGRIIQKRQGHTTSDTQFTSSISTQLDMLIPSSKISQLGQGYFVGCLSQSNNQILDQGVFNAKLLVGKANGISNHLVSLPFVRQEFPEKGAMPLEYYVQKNYQQIKRQIDFLVKLELERIANQRIL